MIISKYRNPLAEKISSEEEYDRDTFPIEVGKNFFMILHETL